MSEKPTHSHLVERAKRWLLNSYGCSIAFSEFATSASETPDAVGWQGRHSVLVECKTSRSDFLADQKKHFRRHGRGIGAERYYLAPPGVLSVADLPPKWGLLECCARHVRIVRRSEGFAERSQSCEIGFLVSMLRRAQVRLGQTPLCDWLRYEHRHVVTSDATP